MNMVRSRYGRLLFLAILGVALLIRLATVRFGLPALNDPDELMFEMGALHMLRGPTLDPGWFGHPATTIMYLLAIIDAAVAAFALMTGRAASPRQFGEMVYADPSWIILPGRVAAVGIALVTIWLTWRLAARFFGQGAGLAAAALLALNPVHVTWSQIIRSDMLACVFMLLCLEASADIAERATWRDYRRAATWLGLAIATKWPFALSALAIGSASMLAVRTGALSSRHAAGRLAVAALMALGVLFLVSPFLLIDHSTALANVRGEGQPYHLGATGGDFWYNLRWYGRGAFLAGFGVPGLALLALGAAGLVRRRLALAILAPVAIAFLVLLCTQSLVWERWALPLMPLGAIVVAAGLAWLAELLRAKAVLRWAPAALVFVAVIPLAARDWSDGHERMTDTRQLASAWARTHIPAGSRILVEHYGFDLVEGPWHLLFPIGDAGCVDAIALLHGRTSLATIDHARAGRSNVDYGTMAPARRADCRPDFAILAQYDRYRQERSRFPAEYAAYRALVARGSVVATIAPQAGRVGGPVVTVVAF